MAKTNIVKPLQIDREGGAYQLEYSYTKPEYRGNGIMKTIIRQLLQWGGEDTGTCIRKQHFRYQDIFGMWIPNI